MVRFLPAGISCPQAGASTIVKSFSTQVRLSVYVARLINVLKPHNRLDLINASSPCLPLSS